MSHAIHANVCYPDATGIGSRAAPPECLRRAAACAARSALAALGGCSSCNVSHRSAASRTWPDEIPDDETADRLRAAILMGHAMTG